MTAGVDDAAGLVPPNSPPGRYRGRFAPSPTGALHFGSLVAAVAGYLDARHHDGEWLVRLEDLDPPRVQPGAAADILRTLEALGLEWDGPVERQSERFDDYRDAVAELLRYRMAYHCSCSRREVAEGGRSGTEGPVYPGTCRPGPSKPAEPLAVRLLTHDEPIEFTDRIQQRYSQRVLSTVGDFIIRRRDGLYAYQLAVVLDDAWQDITHVVRGADLLPSTPRQIHLQRLLGLACPVYAHVPLVMSADGRKLSKRDGAHPVAASDPLPALSAALRFLGQGVPDTGDLTEFWPQAIEAWDVTKVPCTPPAFDVPSGR